MSTQKSQQHEYFTRLDRLQPRESLYQKTSAVFRDVALFYGFTQISSSLLDSHRAYMPLAEANLLDETPLVFCAFQGGEDVVVRPSGVLGALRALASQNAWEATQSQQIFFEGENYFCAGTSNVSRMRLLSKTPSFLFGRHEMGLMVLGEEGPVAEAQIIQIIAKALERFGIGNDDIELRINAIGCGGCHPHFRSAFLAYFRSRLPRLCKNCKHDLKRTPTKILTCPEERCQILANHAPQVLDFLCEPCKKHLKGVLEFLDEIQIPYYLDHMLFRFGSWFSSLVFEFRKSHPIENKNNPESNHAGGDGQKSYSETREDHTTGDVAAVRSGHGICFAEGGRLVHAAELIFGKKTDAVSGSLFFENLERVFPRQFAEIQEGKPQVFFAHLGELAKKKSLGILEKLRKSGIEVSGILTRNAIKSQLRAAERMKVPIALILGQKEAIDATIIVREMESGIQETVPQGKLVEFLKRKLKK